MVSSDSGVSEEWSSIVSGISFAYGPKACASCAVKSGSNVRDPDA